jgi:integrase
MKMFERGFGDWKQYRARFNLSESDEIDLHFGKRDKSLKTFAEAMAEVTDLVVARIHEARRLGRSHVMFIHGRSTSRRGKTTARSQVRNFMRSKHATPLIERKECVQHETVFVARLKPMRVDEPASVGD